VSLRERFAGGGHLADRHFARLWADGGNHPHLASCAACRLRFAEFGAWAAAIGEEFQVEADRAFTSDRLATQQVQINRRLEAMERPGRVIVFPKSTRAVITGRSHGRRWVAAAAAGLIAGVGLGQVLDLHRAIEREPATHFTAATAAERANAIRPVSTTDGDEDFLNGAEAMGPRVKELRALDDMTPHSRELLRRK